MNFREALRSALVNLAGHKLRACLTTLGVVFGVGAVIAMLSIGAGAEQQALELIEELALRGGGQGLFVGCAAGDTAAAVVVQVDA